MSDCTQWTSEERNFIERAQRFAFLMEQLDIAAANRQEEDFQKLMTEFKQLGTVGFDIRNLPSPYLPEVWAAFILVQDTVEKYQRRTSGGLAKAVLAAIQQMEDQVRQEHGDEQPGMLN